MRVRTQTHTYTHTHTLTLTHTYTQTHTLTHILIHMRVRTQTHTYTHTHTHRSIYFHHSSHLMYPLPFSGFHHFVFLIETQEKMHNCKCICAFIIILNVCVGVFLHYAPPYDFVVDVIVVVVFVVVV